MSSIVSRSPPVFGSVSHVNERRCMSMRLGTSTVFLRRAKLRRVRRASAAAKKRAEEGAEARPDKIAQISDALKRLPALTDPTLDDRVCGATSCSPGGCDYRLAIGHFTGKSAQLLKAD